MRTVVDFREKPSGIIELMIAMLLSMVLAGAIISPLGTVNPNMGLPWLIDSFLVVIVGGESALGPVVGAIFVGGAESTLAFFIQPVTASMLVLVFAIVALRFRPQGLAGGRRRL